MIRWNPNICSEHIDNDEAHKFEEKHSWCQEFL